MIWGSCSLEAEARAQVMQVAAEAVAIMMTAVQQFSSEVPYFHCSLMIG